MFPITYQKRLIYTVQGDADWAADKLRQYLAQSLEESEIFKVGPIDGEQFSFKTKFWHRWSFFDEHSVRTLRGIYQGVIAVRHDLNHVVVGYEIDFISTLVFGGAISGCFVLFLNGCALAQITSSIATTGSLSWILPTVLWCTSWWLLWLVLMGGLPVMTISYLFGRFLKGRVNKFFHLMADLGVPLEVIDSH